MDVASFYNKKNRTQEEDVAEGSTRLNSTRSLPRIEFSILAPSTKLKTFYKQDEAIQYRGSDSSTLVFSFEFSSGGVRSFLVGSGQVFWDHYKDIPSKHHYEVIVENKPCKLYLDIEFKIKENPGLDGNAAVDSLLSDLNAFILNNLQLTVHKEDVMILDSTSPTKFSNHAIFSNVVFSNNQCMGQFIQDFLSSLNTKQRGLYTVNKGSCTEFIVDTAVYTRNRNFRLFLSSKFGKKEALGVSENDLFTVKLAEEKFREKSFDLEAETFLASLVTYLPQKSKTPTKYIQYGSCSNKALEDRALPPLCGTPSRKFAKNDTSAEKSPFEEIDDFVKKIVEPGFIRKWNFFQDASLLLYEIGGTRYCGNIGREHKSNNIKFLCNLEEGVLYQRCHDPQCSDYRGPPIPIPKELLPWSEFEAWNEEIKDDQKKDPKRKSEEVCEKSCKSLRLEDEESGLLDHKIQGLSQELSTVWSISGQTPQSSQQLVRSFSLNEDMSTIDRPKHSNSDEDFDDDDIDDNIGIEVKQNKTSPSGIDVDVLETGLNQKELCESIIVKCSEKGFRKSVAEKGNGDAADDDRCKSDAGKGNADAADDERFSSDDDFFEQWKE